MKDEIEKILWNFLQECLKIHHSQGDRKFKTIPDAQKEFTTQLLSLFEKSLSSEEEIAIIICDHLQDEGYGKKGYCGICEKKAKAISKTKEERNEIKY